MWLHISHQLMSMDKSYCICSSVYVLHCLRSPWWVCAGVARVICRFLVFKKLFQTNRISSLVGFLAKWIKFNIGWKCNEAIRTERHGHTKRNGASTNFIRVNCLSKVFRLNKKDASVSMSNLENCLSLNRDVLFHFERFAIFFSFSLLKFSFGWYLFLWSALSNEWKQYLPTLKVFVFSDVWMLSA